MRFNLLKSLCVFGFLLVFLITSKAKAGSYVVGEGDKLQISVWGVASLNFEVKVRPDGMITVPGVGDVIASGRMPEELKKELTVKLKDLVKNPLVTVTVTDITNNKVFVFGSGTKPAVYDINRKTTLLQILCSLSDIKTADLKRAYLLRNREKVKVGFYMLFMLGDIEQDMQIEPNDSIFIPQHTDKNVYVVGGVNNPKAIEYREGLSVMEAILESGGFSKFASPDETRVVRKEDGHDLIIAVKGKKLIRNVDFSQNVKLKPGDFVIVDESIF